VRMWVWVWVWVWMLKMTCGGKMFERRWACRSLGGLGPMGTVQGSALGVGVRMDKDHRSIDMFFCL
jgi:hypothetical protein